MKLVRWIGIVLWGVALGAHADVSAPDHRGRTLTLPAPPQRIVSLLPSLTETVCALGACDRLVAVDRFASWPAQVKALPRVGSLEDAQIERIVALRPDVVLLAPSARALERLESLGLPVLVLESNTQGDVRRSMQAIAALLGTPDRAEALWADIQRDVTTAIAQVPPSMRGQRVYFEVDASPYAAGAGSFIGETLARLGLGNIVSPSMGPFPRLNPEFVVRAQPDLVMAQRRNLADMPKRPGWQALRALKTGRHCGFEDDDYELVTRPGPRLGEAALRLARCVREVEGARR